MDHILGKSKLVAYSGVTLERQSLQVLTDVDFSLDPGEFVYLIGRVGSGKSTLLKSMYAETPIASGRARVFDYDLTHLRRRDIPYLRRRIGIVFQDFQLLTDRDIHANLAFVLGATGWTDRAERDLRIREVLAEVGMQDKAYKMPHELSGGEQQRIVIARALLNKPKLILADEPTGNLDPITGEQIVERLQEISSRGTAVVMATHNMQLVDRYPGRVVYCRNHRLEE
ncbi:MAG: ATP-binding cassette domain-containing protein [Pseudoflavonifractor sp.]|nr:ATP-binding cassette domain-containing protein [Alloprevotella sp.]MCM1116242.1 ATP-binding cassette domain-containing protein [Pseudoflavonifractor sp.]